MLAKNQEKKATGIEFEVCPISNYKFCGSDLEREIYE